MKNLFRILKGIPNGDIGIQVMINDTALETLNKEDLYTEIHKFSKDPNKQYLVNLSIDNSHEVLDYVEMFRLLNIVCDGNVEIEISASGKQFNKIMLAIEGDKSNNIYTTYFDDHDAGNIVRAGLIDVRKVRSSCYLSDIYLRNLDEDSLRYVFNNPLFIFDRDKFLEERAIIRDVWSSILPDVGWIKGFTDVEKMYLIADYINKNIRFGGEHYKTGVHNGRSVYYVADDAKNAISTYKNRQGVCSGQSDLALLLLNNSLAKCPVEKVSGYYVPSDQNHVWIALLENDKYLGVCLTMRNRFIDFSKKGYIEGTITLNNNHREREDYKKDVCPYVELTEKDKNLIERSINCKLAGIVPPGLSSRRNSGFPPKLPPRRNNGLHSNSKVKKINN